MEIKMSKMLLVNCCSDDTYARISAYLLENHKEEVFAGMKQMAAEISAIEIAVLLPLGSTINFPTQVKVYYAPESLITVNPHAAVETIKGKMPRPTVTEEPAEYQGMQVEMITPRDAYKIALSKMGENPMKLMSVNRTDRSEIIEVPYNSNLVDVLNMVSISIDQIKGILLGGIHGKFIPVQELNSYKVVEEELYNSLTVYFKEVCMVEELKGLAKQIQFTSCGKCVLCREGSLQYMTIIDDITAGKAKMTDIDMLMEISDLIEVGAYCSFGQKMPGLITTGLTLFANEVESHIKRKTCPAGVCDAFASYCILPKQCTGCEECLDACPEDAIEGKAGFIHMIDEDLCTKCGKCLPVCEEGAIIKVVGTKPKLPQKLTKVGKF